NRLLEDSNYTYSYDNNGNLIQKTNKATGETTTYTYDTENRVTGISYPGMVAQYKYDSFGRRIEKNVNGVITRYVYDREDILFELDANGNIITEYVHGSGIDEPIAMIRNNQTYYYHADGLGSIVAITDSAGNVVQRYEYNSFGNITYIQDPNFIQPYTYTSREYDPETGLYYYRARYYDPKIGKFISEDPIGLAGGLNLYVYVGNSSVNFFDPLGLDPTDPRTGKVNVVLRCHVNPHRDPMENLIGGLIVTGGMGIVLAPEAMIPMTCSTIVKTCRTIKITVLTNPVAIQNIADFIQGALPGPPPPSPAGYFGTGMGFAYDFFRNKTGTGESPPPLNYDISRTMQGGG
ncbi:MAG: hypothetical protein HZC12_00170, partial [Nitrospirae bacterium]|nr:hypothetical protein [Nitrospirota bacterium]